MTLFGRAPFCTHWQPQSWSLKFGRGRIWIASWIHCQILIIVIIMMITRRITCVTYHNVAMSAASLINHRTLWISAVHNFEHSLEVSEVCGSGLDCGLVVTSSDLKYHGEEPDTVTVTAIGLKLLSCGWGWIFNLGGVFNSKKCISKYRNNNDCRCLLPVRYSRGQLSISKGRLQE